MLTPKQIKKQFDEAVENYVKAKSIFDYAKYPTKSFKAHYNALKKVQAELDAILNDNSFETIPVFKSLYTDEQVKQAANVRKLAFMEILIRATLKHINRYTVGDPATNSSAYRLIKIIHDKILSNEPVPNDPQNRVYQTGLVGIEFSDNYKTALEAAEEVINRKAQTWNPAFMTTWRVNYSGSLRTVASPFITMTHTADFCYKIGECKMDKGEVSFDKGFGPHVNYGQWIMWQYQIENILSSNDVSGYKTALQISLDKDVLPELKVEASDGWEYFPAGVVSRDNRSAICTKFLDPEENFGLDHCHVRVEAIGYYKIPIKWIPTDNLNEIEYLTDKNCLDKPDLLDKNYKYIADFGYGLFCQHPNRPSVKLYEQSELSPDMAYRLFPRQ